MQRRYNITHCLVIHLSLASLFLQSCNESPLIPIQEKQVYEAESLLKTTISNSYTGPDNQSKEVTIIDSSIGRSYEQETLQRGDQFDMFQSPLHLAVQQGHVEIAELLIDQGADVNAKDNHGFSPLQIALKNADMDCIKLLINKGAEVGFQDVNHNTALHWAIKHAGIPLNIRLHLSKHDTPDFKYIKSTSLMYLCLSAIKRDYTLGVIRLLIKQKANINTKNKYGESPLYIAVQTGNLKGINLLKKKGADVKVKDKYGNSLLHGAAESGQLEVAKLLIEAWGFDINVTNNNNESALHKAAKKGHTGLVKFLIKQRISIDAPNKQGYTALSLAIQNDHSAVVKLLSEQGADINMGDNRERTLLHWAASENDVPLIKKLIEQQADINATDQDGCTPMHIAAEKGQIETVSALEEQGADVDARDQDGYTAQELINQRPTCSDVIFSPIILMGIVYLFLVTCIFNPVAFLFFPVVSHVLAFNYNFYRRYIRIYISANNINILDRLAGLSIVRWGNSLTPILAACSILALIYTLIMHYLG